MQPVVPGQEHHAIIYNRLKFNMKSAMKEIDLSGAFIRMCQHE